MQNSLQNLPQASKTAKNLKNLENESQKSMGDPSGPLFFAAYMGTFGTILVRILEDFLYFILDRCWRQLLIFLNDKWQDKRGGGHAA